MPHLRFRGIKKEELIEISKELVDELSPIIDCPRDWFTLEHISTEFIFDGSESKGYPFIEVLWFDRGQDIKDKVSNIIHSKIKPFYKDSDICTTFTALDGKNYYENNKSF